MSHIKVSWEEYFTLLEKLARQVRAQYIPNQIVCIATGGLIPGMVISKIFKAPLAILAAESYPIGKSGTEANKGEVVFARDLAKTRPGFGNRALLIDDLTDTGDTMAQGVEWIQRHYGSALVTLKTATVWHKDRSIFKPDFFVEEILPLQDGEYPWIIQPVERYENYEIEA